MTLKFLARNFAASGELPGRGAALYRAGIGSLCTEQNPGRRDAGLATTIPLEHRIAAARRIAAATVFGGATAIWTGPTVDVAGEDIAADHLSGGLEPIPEGSIQVTSSAVLEAVRTGLFASRGGERLGWAHATFADFLCADWVVSNDLSEAQTRSLFLAPDGRCWPQTRLAATWTVAIAPDKYNFLVEADPSAFLGEVELPGNTLRAAVIDGLFSIASEFTVNRWERSLAPLRHVGAAQQIRAHLHDIDPDRRQLALELADECAAVELRDDLAEIALDRTAETRDRVSAGWAISRLPTSHQSAALRDLAIEPLTSEEDPYDEIKGVALLASWPHAISIEETYEALCPRRQQNFFGAYEAFLSDLPKRISDDDAFAGLQWLVNNLDLATNDHAFSALATRIMTSASRRPRERNVIEAFAQLVIARAEIYEDLLPNDSGLTEERIDIFEDPFLRRAIASSIIAKSPTDAIVFALTSYGPFSMGIVRAEDLEWLSDIYAATADEPTRSVVRTLFRLTFRDDISDHRDLVLDMSHDHPLFEGYVHQLVEPVALDSAEADRMREARRATHTVKPSDPEQSDEINDEIRDLLARFDSGDAGGYWQSVRLLTVAPGSKHFDRGSDPDVVAMPRWKTLDDALRERFVDASDRYIREHSCHVEMWLHKPEIMFHPAEAGYRALMIMLRISPDRLRQIPVSAWREWAPIITSWPTSFINGATWDDKLELLELAGPEAQQAARKALIARADAAVSSGRRPLLTNESEYLWDDTVAACYLSLLETTDGEPREEIVSALATNDFGLVRRLLHEWLEDPTPSEHRRLAAATLVAHDLEASWPELREAFDADLPFAEQVLAASPTVRGFKSAAAMSATSLADIYLWLRANFPPDTDPMIDEAHMVGPREEVGQWRDRILRQLQDEGSPQAVSVIRSLVAAQPGNRLFSRVLVAAEAALRRDSWQPTPLSHLLRLAHDPRTVVVNDSPGLADSVSRAIDEIQEQLTGATPESHYLWDTYSGRPKTEDDISDYLANNLSRVLGRRRVVVNREVQIRRSRPGGMGERTDLLVDAFSVDPVCDRLSVPIEVKGAWNAGLLSAMDAQLVERYMHDVGASDGFYIIAWPDVASWTDTTDARRRSLARLDREEVERQLLVQKSRNLLDGRRVHIVHLRIDYLRPA
ncbi:hypothetical protein ACQFYA_18415 [Promicromonospora sp. Marseille-Q5078]